MGAGVVGYRPDSGKSNDFERTEGNQEWQHARSDGQNSEGRQEGCNQNKDGLGRGTQENEPMEEKVLEHKGKKVVEKAPTGNPGGESVGKRDEKESEGMGKRKCEEKRS